ncbi:two-component system response regulator [Geomonas limicola]|uniref:Two-component system response regulator n=1 Tax=Geomonas limicola TaxID=2740186 RepID=A0A6V8N7K7_9BACT|nr:response regulator [Geomonas limicola]GFO67807.1 two-component system response regulator [Geomonas limicola]
MEPTILLVDDVRLFLEMQKEFLASAAVRVETARNGREALECIGKKRPDLVFMDIEMPEMDGIECCRTIKNDPGLANLPVVMITAKGDAASQQRCRDVGCDDFLTKPLSRAMFLETAGRFLSGLERRTKRSTVSLPVTVRAGGSEIAGWVLNLSAGGAFVAAPCLAEVGRSVQLCFQLPGGTLQECRAKVVWTQPAQGASAGFGVSFLLLSDQTRSALEQYLKSGIYEA